MKTYKHQALKELADQQVREWAILNTFDMFAPAHDTPQSASTLRRWFDEAGFEDAWVGRLGFLVGRGTKPPPSRAYRETSAS